MRCCSTGKCKRVTNRDSKVGSVRPAKSLPGALRRIAFVDLGRHFLQESAGGSVSRRSQQLCAGDYAMDRAGGRGGGTAGYHSHRSPDERASATGFAALVVAGGPFQREPDLRRWIEQRSQPAKGARKNLAGQSP